MGPSQFIQFLRSWTQSLQNVIPIWQQQRPNAVVGYRFLWSLVTPIDITVENTLQGINDWGPGSPDSSSTALPMIAQSRGLIQGEAETDANFAIRMQNFRTNGLVTKPVAPAQVWNQTGKSTVLAQQIQQYLGNNPLVRVIERIYSTSGTTTATYETANTDGTTSKVVANWDWDSISGGDDSLRYFTGTTARGYWSDTWIVVYPAEYVRGATVTPLTGQEVPVVSHDAILRIVVQWKGVHTFVRAIIWSYNVTLFDPANPGASGNPDGTWGRWAKDDGSGNQIPARNIVDARYWIPPQG